MEFIDKSVVLPQGSEILAGSYYRGLILAI